MTTRRIRWTGRLRIADLRSLTIHAALLAGMASAAFAQEAKPEAKKEAERAPLARYIPRDDLVFLAEFDGLAAHEKAWQGSATYKLLNETKLGALLEDLIDQGMALIQDAANPEDGIKGSDFLALMKFIAREGFVLAASGKGKDARAVLVIRKGDRPEVARILSIFADANARDVAKGKKEKTKPATVQKSGRKLHSLGDEDYWWFENGDLVLTQKELADSILETLDRKRPSATENPTRAELARTEDGFVSMARAFIDFSLLPPMPPEATKLGWDGIRRLDLRWGIQDEALLGKLRIVAPGSRRGILKLLDQPTFGIGTLPPIPPGQTGFVATSLAMPELYDGIISLARQISPTADPSIVAFEAFAQQVLGTSARHELLPLLGPKIAFYLQPTEANPNAPQALMLLKAYSGSTLSVQVRDFAGLSGKMDQIIESINRVLKDEGRNVNKAAGPPMPSFRKLEKPGFAYLLEFPEGVIAPPIRQMFSPTLILGKDQLILSMTQQGAERALESGGGEAARRWAPTGDFSTMAKRLPEKLMFLSVSDPRETFPDLVANLPSVLEAFNTGIMQAQRQAGNPATGIPIKIDPAKLPKAEELRRLLFPASLALSVDDQAATVTLREPIPSISSPGTAGVVVALLLPAVQAAREAARRIQCTNDLKQIALAMHNYHDANNAFPMPAVVDKAGKPLLSWRVAILPFLGQQLLYEKFKLDEPWDSPHNKALLEEMPAFYRCPSRADEAKFATTYRVIVGPGAFFEAGKQRKIDEVTDGTSNTIMVVEAKEPVEWTKPDELTFNPDAVPSLLGAGSPHPGGFNTTFADGSVRFIKYTIDLKVFRSLITAKGGEQIAADR